MADFVAAIDFGATKMAVATATLGGEVLHRTRLATDAARGAPQAIERAIGAARELTGGTGGRCVAAGVVSPGIVLEDRILLAPNVPGWEELALARAVRDGLGLDAVRVGTDVKAATLAEARWGALRGADPGVFLNLGTGVAAGLVVGGEVVAGAHGAAGEIGYNLRAGGDDGAANGRAPLEELAGGRAIGERASALLGEPLSAADAFAHPGARALIDETLAELAVHVANLAILVDPARIAVGGGLMGSTDAILAALERRLRTAAPAPPELVVARFPDDGALRGAIALAQDAAAR